jgi:hypothetical protein
MPAGPTHHPEQEGRLALSGADNIRADMLGA